MTELNGEWWAALLKGKVRKGEENPEFRSWIRFWWHYDV